MHGDGGGADVAGDAIGLVLEAGIERHQRCLTAMDRFVNGCGDFPIALAQDLLHLAQKIGVDRKVLEAPVGLDRQEQPVEIAQGLVHVGFLDLDIAHLDRRIALDDAAVGILAHHLRIDHGILRDVDHQVAENLRRAGEPAAGLQVALFGVAHLIAAKGRDVVVGRGDAVLGENAFLHINLAAPADAAAAANAFHMHAELPRGIEYGGVGRKAPALARRHEQDEVVGHGWVTRLPSGRRGRRGGGCRRPRGPGTGGRGRSPRYAAGSPCKS